MSAFERRIDQKLILSVVATGIMSCLGVVVETAMNVTFPALMREFSITTSNVQWVTTAYLLVLAIVIPTSAFLKRNCRTKTLFVVAISLFILGSILCALAPQFWILVLGRIVQGIGTGIALPLMINIILEQVPFESLGLMMGVASLIIAVAPAIGPSLGGLIVTFLGWRMIFWCILPFLIVAFFIGIYAIRQVTPIKKTHFSILDLLLLSVGFTCFVFATSYIGEWGWNSWQILTLLLVSIIFVGGFCIRSLKNKYSLLDVRIFTFTPYTMFLCSLMLVQFVTLGLGFLIPNYGQLAAGKTALIAGCLLLPGCVLGAVMAPLSGRILDRFGPAWPILVGLVSILLCTLGLFAFGTTTDVSRIMWMYILFAVGQGFALGNMITAGLRVLPVDRSADGNATITTLQQLAGALGTAIMSTIVAHAQAAAGATPDATEGHAADLLAQATAAGTRQAFLLAIIFVLLALVFATIGLRKGKASRRALSDL